MKKVLFFILLCAVIAIGVYYLEKQDFDDRSLASSPLDLNISQYSDRHITENAIISDGRFSHIAFAEPETKVGGLFEEQLASVIEFLKSFIFWRSEKTVTEREEYGAWIWTPTLDITVEYAQSILDDLKKEGVNTIYLSIDSYLDVFAIEDSQTRIEKEEQFSKTLDNFIALAKERGMNVDAEAGWRNWAEDGHTYKPFVIVSFVKEFNSKHENKFRGFQYDIEPYMLDLYQRDEESKKAILTRFTKLVDETAKYLKDSPLKFSIVIPHFYDELDKQTPKFSYAGREGFAFRQLLRVLEEKEGSEIIIMSYRNFVVGEDGSQEISQNEMKTAQHGGFNTRLILAQETGDISPNYVTFHGTSKNYFEEETSKLRSTFASNPNFAGLAIHYANAFITLK